MTLPNVATNTTQSISVIATKHRDGSVLLSAASDRVFKLNGVGALTWVVLEQSRAALGVDEVVHQLWAQFDALNAGGALQYDVSLAQLRQDTARFVESLVHNGLLRVETDASGREGYRVKADVSGTTSSTVAELCVQPGTPHVSASPLSSVSPLSPLATTTDNIHPTKRETVVAFAGLLAFDLLLRFRGFEALIRKVERWPTKRRASASTTDLETCRRVCAMVNRAQVYYPKKAMCLQHSAVVTCLLRRAGVAAEMVLAAQEFPPKGHAWVEVGGTVVNDKASVREIYLPLRRV